MIHIGKHEGYARAAAEINDLSIALGKVQMRLASIEASLSTMERSEESDQAAHVAAALAFAAGERVTRPVSPIDTFAEERLALKQQEDALRNTMAARQQSLRALEQTLSADVHRDLLPTHRKLASRYLAKLLELEELHKEEAALVRSVEQHGYSPRFAESVVSQRIGTLDKFSGSAMEQHASALRGYAA